MSDTISKYHEMIEDGHVFRETPLPNTTRTKAYRLLCEYDEEVIIEAYNILQKINA